MSACPNCGDTGFTLTMEPCSHGVQTRPPMAADLTAVIEELAELAPLAPWEPPTTGVTHIVWEDDDESPWDADGRSRTRKAAKAASTKPASEKQYEFLTRLVAERDDSDHPDVAHAKAALAAHVLSPRGASDLIDKLMAVPKTKSAPRPNNYPGDCAACGTHVDAKAGRIEKDLHGRWLTYHLDGECPEGDDHLKALADKVREPGVYRRAGAFYRVRAGRYDKHIFWAERIVVAEPDDGEGDDLPHVGRVAKPITFVRVGRASFLRASDKISLAEARSFGVACGACINCGLTLDGEDGKSLTAGYGATCAKNNGWAYPSTADMKAIAAGTTTWDDLLTARS